MWLSRIIFLITYCSVNFYKPLSALICSLCACAEFQKNVTRCIIYKWQNRKIVCGKFLKYTSVFVPEFKETVIIFKLQRPLKYEITGKNYIKIYTFLVTFPWPFYFFLFSIILLFMPFLTARYKVHKKERKYFNCFYEHSFTRYFSPIFVLTYTVALVFRIF